MIRFYCEYCAHKISVRDKDAGRRGKCPKCGEIIVVPTESTVIEFHCEKCDRKISAPKEHAGKKAICPKCKSTFIIPTNQFAGPAETRNGSGDLIAHTVDSPRDLTLIDVPEKYRLKDEPVDQNKVPEQTNVRRHEPEQDLVAEETESIDQRKLPWILDIFLYPMSFSGLLHLGIFTIIPLLITIVRISLGPFGMAVAFPGFLINVAVMLYLYWYVSECIRDSAKGGLRAPEAFATSGLSDMWSQALHIIGCYIIFLGPAFFYFYFIQKTDVVFWFLLGFGVFFFPMGLLACVMFDSIRGLNPILLIPSILSTFFQYCGLILLIIGIVLGFKAIQMKQTDDVQTLTITMIILGRVFYLILLYITFVVAHLIGRFYWRYEKKLNWEV